MKKVVIIYNSKKGTTKRYAEQISVYLNSKKLTTQVLSIDNYSEEFIQDADYLMLGCWTSGLMVFMQNPEKDWRQFASRLPETLKAKTALFTTYKVLTGSMFKNMRKQLNGKADSCKTEIKSRNGFLSEKDKEAIDAFIG
jgi:flavodoxin